ncbi:zinc finger protein 572-like [Photinus pyralis]|uniref:zinc finger protein 572-like n=1 Tax=Photinus pyralis TaxID=7054 RepID=UPI0012677C0B|nr:zinc finger protein 572-like [Photinus pyralis]
MAVVTYTLEYADDILILITDKFEATLCRLMMHQLTLRITEEWCSYCEASEAKYVTKRYNKNQLVRKNDNKRGLQMHQSLKKEVDWGGGCADDKNTRESPSDYARHPHDPSLKKEVDWGGGATEDKKSSIENYSEYSRHPHDSDLDRGDDDSPRLYPCMYCGASFPHQSKLTRHILSHSLETLKYREQLQHPTSLNLPEPLHLMESHFSGRVPISHLEAAEATDHPSTPMDLELSGDGAGVVLCKFCGKSFPDVSSLIAHLPVHTGDRPFKCEFCGKAFKLRHHMKDHCRVHTGERPFRCALCGKTFSRSTILKAHEKTHFPKYVRNFLSPSPLDAKEESPH